MGWKSTFVNSMPDEQREKENSLHLCGSLSAPLLEKVDEIPRCVFAVGDCWLCKEEAKRKGGGKK